MPRPTSFCFGGPNLDTLYVTSASVRLNEAALASAPLSGSLFSIRIPGVRGLLETTFAGELQLPRISVAIGRSFRQQLTEAFQGVGQSAVALP